jgi:hypothetical protein
MVLEAPAAKSVISQWGGLASAVVASLGLLWGIINYIQDMALEIRLSRVQVAQILSIEKDMQAKIDRDHDEIIRVRTELLRYMGPSYRSKPEQDSYDGKP